MERKMTDNNNNNICVEKKNMQLKEIKLPFCVVLGWVTLCTMGRITMKSTRRILSHSLVRPLSRSHRSLSRLPRAARFARALSCAHSFVRSLTQLLPSAWERGLQPISSLGTLKWRQSVNQSLSLSIRLFATFP